MVKESWTEMEKATDSAREKQMEMQTPSGKEMVMTREREKR